MNIFITKEELAQNNHIYFSADLDESGLHISSCPKDALTPSPLQTSSTGLLTDLNHLTWQEISTIGQSGQARKRIALGATKIDHMKDGYDAEYRIIGFDHDDLADGSGKAPFTWQMTKVLKDHRKMNAESTNKGGWEACELRKWLNSNFVELCSTELQSVIHPVIKLTSAGDTSKGIIESVDRIFIISEKELYGRVICSVPSKDGWYDYYRLEDVPYFALNDDGSAVWWWLRSPYCGDIGSFCCMYANGHDAGTGASWSAGVRPCFCF